jgi:ATP-dependent helicase HrpB
VSNLTETAIRQFSYLPVSVVLDQLTAALKKGHAVLSAPTGSGKTTLAPLALLCSHQSHNQKIIVLEPRRIAARAAAMRMSQMLHEEVGNTVGYRTRFDSRISTSTRIEVVTEGILIRKLQQDPELADTNLIIFDEFHERSLQADLGLALSLDLCELRDDLRLLVMSATLATEGICKLLSNAPLITATGKSYPVEISYLPPQRPDSPIPRQMCHGIVHAWHQTSGDILAFFPGAGEILNCSQMLLQEQLNDTIILPLYGNLSYQEQDRVFSAAHAGQRRIILATPIAETSLTIEGISCVVDSGYFRKPIHDHASGLSRLTLSRISCASAEQRTGRAGRLGPGKCYRLWSKEVEYSMLPHTPPEISNADLSSLVLELALWGVTDPEQLRWLDTPRASSWENATSLLQQLGLLDKQNHITHAGRQVAALPLHPRLGVILLHGNQRGFSTTACLLAAILAERDIFKRTEQSTDIEERVRVLADLRSSSAANVPAHVDRQLCRKLLEQAAQWQRILAVSKEKHQKPEKKIHLKELGNLLAYGYPDRIAMLRAGTSYRYQLANGRGAELPPADILSGTPLMVVPQVDARQGNGRIFMAAPISESELQTHHPQLVHERENIFWDEANRRVQAVAELVLGELTLRSKPLKNPNNEKVCAVFMLGIQRSGIEHLPWNRDARELQTRICSLAFWQPGKWPDLSDNTLLEDLDWLQPYCQQMTSLDRLKSLDLKTILLSRLSWEQQVQLEKLAPSHIQVPSGSRIRLSYTPGESPVLAVRLQELFGLTDTPTVCNGSVTILLHLLSPARRPMQVTRDLKSFWRNTYPEVRKELAGRYPKHYWPENPLEAEATSKTKKRMLPKSR